MNAFVNAIAAIVCCLVLSGQASACELVEYPLVFGDGSSTLPKILYKGGLVDVQLEASGKESKKALAELYALDWRIWAATFSGPTTRCFVIGELDTKNKVLFISDWYLKSPFYVMTYDQRDAIVLEGNTPAGWKPILTRTELKADDFSQNVLSVGLLTQEDKKAAAIARVRK